MKRWLLGVLDDTGPSLLLFGILALLLSYALEDAQEERLALERRIEALEAEVFARDCGNPGAYVEPPTCTPGPRVR